MSLLLSRSKNRAGRREAAITHRLIDHTDSRPRSCQCTSLIRSNVCPLSCLFRLRTVYTSVLIVDQTVSIGSRLSLWFPQRLARDFRSVRGVTAALLDQRLCMVDLSRCTNPPVTFNYVPSRCTFGQSSSMSDSSSPAEPEGWMYGGTQDPTASVIGTHHSCFLYFLRGPSFDPTQIASRCLLWMPSRDRPYSHFFTLFFQTSFSLPSIVLNGNDKNFFLPSRA